MNNSENKNHSPNLIISIFTPIFILIICLGIAIVVGIKPYNKISTYLNIAFMDTLKTLPETNGVTSGLNIQDNDINIEYEGITYSDGEIIYPTFGEQFAILRSDNLDFSIPVYWGSNSELLERGACQASNSVLPGQSGNSVISAHVNTFFADLYKFSVDDVLTINTNYGIFTYKVVETVEFSKYDKTYVIPTEDDRLTLYTCKSDILGSSDTRIGVVCEPLEKQFYNEREDAE